MEDGDDNVPRRRKTPDGDARVNCWSAVEGKTFLATAKAADARAGAFYAVALDGGAHLLQSVHWHAQLTTPAPTSLWVREIAGPQARSRGHFNG